MGEYKPVVYTLIFILVIGGIVGAITGYVGASAFNYDDATPSQQAFYTFIGGQASGDNSFLTNAILGFFLLPAWFTIPLTIIFLTAIGFSLIPLT